MTRSVRGGEAQRQEPYAICSAASRLIVASRYCEERSNPSDSLRALLPLCAIARNEAIHPTRFAPCCRFASLRGTKQSSRPASRLTAASRHCEERSNPSDSLRALLSLRVIARNEAIHYCRFASLRAKQSLSCGLAMKKTTLFCCFFPFFPLSLKPQKT